VHDQKWCSRPWPFRTVDRPAFGDRISSSAADIGDKTAATATRNAALPLLVILLRQTALSSYTSKNELICIGSERRKCHWLSAGICESAWLTDRLGLAPHGKSAVAWRSRDITLRHLASASRISAGHVFLGSFCCFVFLSFSGIFPASQYCMHSSSVDDGSAYCSRSHCVVSAPCQP
jgi:hypothetical protein